MQAFIRNVQELGVITEFDEVIWGLLVDGVILYTKNDIRVEFKVEDNEKGPRLPVRFALTVAALLGYYYLLKNSIGYWCITYIF